MAKSKVSKKISSKKPVAFQVWSNGKLVLTTKSLALAESYDQEFNQCGDFVYNGSKTGLVEVK
jgi:hypothetical protein